MPGFSASTASWEKDNKNKNQNSAERLKFMQKNFSLLFLCFFSYFYPKIHPMRKINILFLVLSLIVLAIMCSGMSMLSVAKEYRFTTTAMNPWNGVEGIFLTIKRFFNLGEAASIGVTVGLLLLLWWRIYALLKRTFYH